MFAVNSEVFTLPKPNRPTAPQTIDEEIPKFLDGERSQSRKDPEKCPKGAQNDPKTIPNVQYIVYVNGGGFMLGFLHGSISILRAKNRPGC